MPVRTSALNEATRLALHLRVSIGTELRTARLALGATQTQLGAAIGVSRNRISRVELAKAVDVSVGYLVKHAAAVGLKPSIKFYPVGGGIRDAAQARYIAKFVDRIGKAWRVKLDVPMPIPGDLRAIDVLLTGACTIAVEVVTRLTDLQALLRAAQLKQRDIGANRLIIVVAGTHSNRRALANLRITLGSSFDMDTQRVIASLAKGDDPGRDAIIVLG